MLFSAGLLSLLAASVAAQTAGFDAITAPTENQLVDVGSTLNIVWDSTVSEPVTISLLYGASQSTLQVGETVAVSIESSVGTYAWTVPASVAGYATYGFKLSLDSDPSTFQYSFPFQIAGSASSSSAAAAVATPTTAGTPSASQSSTVQVPPASAPATVTLVETSSASSVAIATPAPFATGAPVVASNFTGNSSWSISTSVLAATGTGSSPVATSSSGLLPSSGAYRTVAVQGLSLVAALGFTAALLL